ncbi:MBL fold metallo-hydrolase [Streptomyces rubrogriseus]|uniref:MBL fold metallo-hydrolase n=1 Tax=Streptomyces rubrogriseus TaxID=194673 RepID=A0A6G3TFD0_9ACTN|nr:MBL fold metallo-hydrolase [Streptomyces rubrogriseus]NEC34721.1 MBL fold metallo-hydrolase [Streptomyces rubrogriseus]
MLSIDVFTSDYKPIAAPLPGWDAGQRATWPASTATLVHGRREAVLVDALITEREARDLTEWIRAKDKVLTTVYVTHGHADHFLGLPVVLEAFPDAVAVALPEVVPYAEEQLSGPYLAYWESLFPGLLPARPVVPRPLDGEVIGVDGHEVWPVLVGQSDTDPSSVVHVPDLDAVVGGDVAYNGIHMWLAQTDHAARARWLEALDTVEALRPATVVAGHRHPAAPDDNAASVLAASRRYLIDFDEAVEAGTDATSVMRTMTAKHGDRGNPYTLFASATAQYPDPAAADTGASG